jgi:tetratricopeptide (TPR) repeat protein
MSPRRSLILSPGGQVRHLEEATRLQPNYFDAYNDLGAFYSRNGKHARAAELFEFAVWRRPVMDTAPVMTRSVMTRSVSRAAELLEFAVRTR